MPECLGKFLMSSVGKISQSNILIREKSVWNYSFLSCLSTAPHKVLLRYFLINHTCFFPIWTMPKSDNSSSENCADSQLSLIVLYSDNLRHSATGSWVFLFLFLKEVGDGWVYQRIQSWIDFCFALSFASWLCQMQCVSHAVSLFREPWLGWLISIQKQAKEDKTLLCGLLRLQISN